MSKKKSVERKPLPVEPFTVDIAVSWIVKSNLEMSINLRWPWVGYPIATSQADILANSSACMWAWATESGW